MSQVLQVAAGVATPLALLGLIAALAFYAYSRRLKHQEKSLDSLPPNERATAIDRYLSRYKLGGEDLPKADRVRLITQEMEKNYRLVRFLATLSAVVFVICFVTAVAAYAVKERSDGTPVRIAKTARLDISVQRMGLDNPEGTNIDSTVIKNTDPDRLLDEAATWVKSTLDRHFPRAEQALKVTAVVVRDQPGGDPRIEVEPKDALREDRFWMFSGVTKTGHPRAEVAKEATREAIARSKKILLHVDRPGYDLQLIQLPADGQPQTVSLNRLEEPSLTIIVDSIAGNESLAERLRSKLRDSGLAVGSPKELEAKRGAYIESKAPDLTPYQRLTKLREALR